MANYKRKLVTLVFEGGSLDGLEIKCHRPKFGQLVQLAKLEAQINQTETMEQVAAVLESVVPFFLESAKWWNLEEDDVPIPKTKEGLESLDFEDEIEILYTWMSNIMSSDTLAGKAPEVSEDTREIEELELPVEILTP
jgi:hypothetical protein